MHDLTARFAREFRLLQQGDREDVARQLLGFLGAFVKDTDDDWARLVFVDGEGAMSNASSKTLVELMNEAGTVPGSKRWIC